MIGTVFWGVIVALVFMAVGSLFGLGLVLFTVSGISYAIAVVVMTKNITWLKQLADETLGVFK